MDDDDKVKPIPVKFKTPPRGDPPFLKIVDHEPGGCNHRYRWRDTGAMTGHMENATYQLRDGETEIECGLCGTRLDPMFVLRIMANEENLWSRARERYIEDMRRLKERSRTKCYHCGKMTEISRR